MHAIWDMFEPTDFKSILWEKLSAYIEKHIQPQVVQMAIDKDHRVVFSPPYHSDLQPIELVWANVKGHVGRRYTDGTGRADVKERLEEAFEVLKASTIQGCIKAADVGRRYTDGTGLADVKERLEEAFEVLKASTIQGSIKAAEGKLQKL
ncbi:hypothetical protein AaE_012530 [Aphanomyces astaci]|uniref:Tc1-like transposase DDE domain-containing protein n=1 Tax=Aphanomyces astaci TaxID=112090 RepID=A0A6A4ZFE6_APHAT|nr:hypothetical protein AaE_012530 [Aphanomyces astaci]